MLTLTSRELRISPVDPQLALFSYTRLVSMRRTAPRWWAAALLALVACSEGSSTGTTTSTTPASTTTTIPDDRMLLLGIVLPRGGSTPDLGVSMRAAISLAVSEINDSGGVLGHRVRVLTRDEGDNPAEAAVAVQDLIQLGVDAIIGPASSIDLLGTLHTAVTAGVLTCSPTASAMSLDEFPDNGLLIRTVPSDSLQALALAKVVENSGSPNAVVVYLDDAYGRPFAEATERALRARGTTVEATVGFSGSEKSIASAVQQVTAAAPEVVVVIANGMTGPNIIEAIDAAFVAPKPTYIVNDAVRRTDSSAQPFGRDLAPRVMGLSPAAYPSSIPFLTALKTADPTASGLFAQNTYDCVNLLALAAQSTGSTTPATLAAAIPNVSGGGSGCASFPACNQVLTEGRNPDYNGPGGTITIDSTGNTTSAVFDKFTFDASGRDVGDGFVSIGNA